MLLKCQIAKYLWGGNIKIPNSSTFRAHSNSRRILLAGQLLKIGQTLMCSPCLLLIEVPWACWAWRCPRFPRKQLPPLGGHRHGEGQILPIPLTESTIGLGLPGTVDMLVVALFVLLKGF